MANLKYSRQREAILNFLMTRTDHPTADCVYENVKLIYPNISLGTVYRNLQLLTSVGKIMKVSSRDGIEHFDATTCRHHHLICENCGRIDDVKMDNVDEIMERAAEQYPGIVADYSIQFIGICEECKKKESTENN